MAYSNYVNATYSTTGSNQNTYTNYANQYKNSSNSTSPYGFTTVAGSIGTSFSYTNYNNWHRAAPTAYTIPSTTLSFTAGTAINPTRITTLQNDIRNLSVTKVSSVSTNPITTTPSFTTAASGAMVSRNIINEMITNISSLWATIRGTAVTGIPGQKAAGDTLSSTEMQALVSKTQELANVAQPASATYQTPPTARTSGYLNCAHWLNYPGSTTYSAPYAAAYTHTPTGSVTYNLAEGTNPTTNR